MQYRWYLVIICLCAIGTWAAPLSLGLPDGGNPACARIARIRADWACIQPQANTWSFTALDAAIRTATAAKQEVVLVLGPTPAWSITYLVNPSPEQVRRAKPDLATYQTYVTAVAKRYAGKVRYYQLWERPDASTLLALPSFVYKLYRTGAQALHAVNPTLRAVAAEPGDVSLGWLREYLATATGNARPDVLLLAPTACTSDAFAWHTQTLRTRILPADGAPALWADLPLGGEGVMRWDMLTAAILQHITTLLFHPIAPETPASEADIQLAARFLDHLAGAEFTGYQDVAPGIHAAIFTTKDGTVLLAPPGEGVLRLKPSPEPLPDALATAAVVTQETPNADAVTLEVPADGIAVPLVATAILLHGVTMQRAGQTPDYAPPPVAGALVTLDPAGVDACAICPLPKFAGGCFTVTRQGETSILCTVRDEQPWIYFDVPNGFLFFNSDAVPVEVRVQVLGVRSAQKSGFSICYDSLNGFSTTPWQWTDVGEGQSYTYTFRLTDALFANRDGYDFRLDMGGSAENLRVTQVTVTKVQ